MALVLDYWEIFGCVAIVLYFELYFHDCIHVSKLTELYLECSAYKFLILKKLKKNQGLKRWELMHSFHKQVLNSLYVPGITLGAGEIVLKRIKEEYCYF